MPVLEEERLVVIEEHEGLARARVPEQLRIHVIVLKASSEVSIEDLVVAARQMRPDRILVIEAAEDEARQVPVQVAG